MLDQIQCTTVGYLPTLTRDDDGIWDTPNYEARYDLDHDCNIDIVDIMLVVVHWGETCE